MALATAVRYSAWLGVAGLVSFMASGDKLLLNQLVMQALKLRTRDNKITAETVNREKASLITEPRLTLRAIAQRNNRQR
ncbi:MAG: hypothetical protein CJBNEKGG_00756 [Prosthecobacter sp.]|nr:hypothetical protein [Prosthecobacter sp.]